MRAKYAMALLLASLLALGACDQEARMDAKGFRLPDGDAQVGAQHIVASEEAFEGAGRVLLGGGDSGFI